MAKRAGIGRAELRVLEYVQHNEPVTVRQVAEHFAASEGVGRTTILNVLVRLWRKGHLKRRRAANGRDLYSAREDRLTLMRRLVGEFVGEVLGGNVSPFVAYLAEKPGELSADERQQLIELLRKLDKKEEG